MTEKTNSCLCHSFGPLCKVCKETPCTRCQAKSTSPVCSCDEYQLTQVGCGCGFEDVLTVSEAAELGKQAFRTGLGCAPVNSPDFMVRFATVKGPMGSGLPYLAAFSEAWMKLQRERADQEWAAFLLENEA